MDYSKILFQYYNANIKSSKAIGFVSLHKFIEIHKNPNEHTKTIFQSIKEAAKTNNLKLKNQLKQDHLFYFTPCVNVKDYRKYDNITTFTGLAVLDFDKIDNATEFKYFLFNEYQHIIACWISPSKKGVKALIKIPIVETIAKFKSYYYGISDEMDIYDGFDPSGQNAVLPLFQSYDPGILLRFNTRCWRKTAERKNSFNYQTENVNYSYGNNKESTILKIINTGLNNINDNGHPQLRSLCICIGGYIAANYIDRNVAANFITNAIKSHNYLNKDVNNYIKTVNWSLNQGAKKPLKLNY